jgi:hypothetical protein
VAAAELSELLAPAGETALIVMGDGAAARSQGAPGHIDDRSFAFDDRVAELLEKGDGASLATLDLLLAEELMATGRHSWPVAGSVVAHAGGSSLEWRGDPFGLTYLVAVWRP